MKEVAVLKYLRSAHPVGLVLSVCGILVAACLIPIIAFFIYMKGEPSMADMKLDLRAVQSGAMKPDHSGLVASAKHIMYVTRAADGATTVLWPYNLVHDDNYFEGYLFSDHILTFAKTVALAPTRYLTAHKPWMTHLTIDRKINEHWYHVQGEMYK